MRCFKSTEERARVAQEIMQQGHVECEATVPAVDGHDELVVQKILQWRVQMLGAYCVLRQFSHRNVFEDGGMVRKAEPFFHLLFSYERSDGSRAAVTMELDDTKSDIITSSPPPQAIWTEAMEHFDTSLRYMQQHVREAQPLPLAREPHEIALVA